MTKRLIITIAFAFVTIITTGQSYVGVKGAYTMSNIAFVPSEDSKLLFGSGLDFGFAYKHFESKYVGIQAEAYITNRGYKMNVDTTFAASYKRINTYIELPLFIQFRLNLKIVYLHVNAGPYIAYLLSAKEGDNTSGTYKFEKIDFNVLRDNRFDYGLAGGAGLSYDFKFGTIQAEARFGYGFGDLYDHTYTDMPQQSKSITQSVSITYFYRFGKIE